MGKQVSNKKNNENSNPNPIAESLKNFLPQPGAVPTAPALLFPEGKNADFTTSTVPVTKYSDYLRFVETGSKNLDVNRANNQSGWEQAWHSLKQAVWGEIVGGTIAGVGSIPGFFTDLITEGQRNEADFSNDILKLGLEIQEETREDNPIYRTNPDKTFDVGDPGWWFEGLPSVVSTISMLIPARGTVGAISLLGKATGIAQKMGKTASLLTKAGGTALLMRNAENFRESAGVVKEVRDNTQRTVDLMSDDEFNRLLQSTKIGQEFAETGKEATRENYSNFVAAKAGFQSYKVNSANIVFDFLQTAAAMKMLSGATRTKNVTNLLGVKSRKVLEAEAAALGKTVTTKALAWNTTKQFATALAGMTSEGIEEIVNFVGSEEGKVIGDVAVGKEVDTVDKRISSYLSDGHAWESGFWGFIGGGIFQGVAPLFERGAKKGYQENLNQSIQEIQNRDNYTKEMAAAMNKLQQMEDKGEITPEQHDRAKIVMSREIAFKMGIDAARVGNTDLLMDMVKSNEYNDIIATHLGAQGAKLTESDFNALKTVLLEGVREAENVVKAMNRRLTNTRASDTVKAVLFNQGVQNAFNIQQRQAEIAELQAIKQEIESVDFKDAMGNPEFNAAIENETNNILLKELKGVQGMFTGNQAVHTLIQNKIDQITEQQEVNKETPKAKLTADQRVLAEVNARITLNQLNVETLQTSTTQLTAEENMKRVNERVETMEKLAKKAKREKIKEDIKKDIEDGKSAEEIEKKYKNEEDPEVKKAVKEGVQLAKEASKVFPVEEREETVDETKKLDEIAEDVIMRQPTREDIEEMVPTGKVIPAPKTGHTGKSMQRRAGKSLKEGSVYAARYGEGETDITHFTVQNGNLVEIGNPDFDPNKDTRKFSNLEEVALPESTQELAEEIKSTSVVAEDADTSFEFEIPIDEEDTFELEYVEEGEIRLQIDEETIAALVVDDMKMEQGSADIYMRGIQDAEQQGTIVKQAPGKYKTKNAEISSLFKAISDIQPGDEVEFVIESDGTGALPWMDAYIAVKVNGVKLGYLNNSKTFDAVIKNQMAKNASQDFILRLQRNKAQTQVIRQFVYKNRGTRVVSKIGFKKHGTVIPSEQLRNPLEVLGPDWRFAFTGKSLDNVPELIVENETERYQINTGGGFYNWDGDYQRGGEYVLVPGHASTKGDMHSYIPLKLVRGRISREDSREVFKAIQGVVDLMRKGNVALNNEQLVALKNQIKEYIAVNNSNVHYNDTDGSVREIPAPYFKIHNNRIEFTSRDNTHLVTIWFNDEVTNQPKIEVHEFKHKSKFNSDAEFRAAKGKKVKSVFIDPSDTTVDTRREFGKVLLEELRTKRYNVDYNKLQNEETNARELFESGRLLADFGALYTHDGEFISNFWGKPLESAKVAENWKNGNLLIGVLSSELTTVDGKRVDTTVELPSPTARKAAAIARIQKEGLPEPTDTRKQASEVVSERKRSPQTAHDHIAIAFGEGLRIAPESFDRFLDPNLKTEKLNFIKKGGRNLDDLADSISQSSGMPITMEDIIDFIENYKSATDYWKQIENKENDDLAAEEARIQQTTTSLTPAQLKNLEEKVLATQANISKTDNYYVINGKKYHRVTNVIGSTFEGDSSLYEDSRIAGNYVDTIIRDFFMGKEPKNDNYMSEAAFNVLVDRLQKVEEAMKKRGQKFLTNNIVVYSDEFQVAGELDILALNTDGSVHVYDVKTSKKSFYQRDASGNIVTTEISGRKVRRLSPSYLKQYANKSKTIIRSKKEQHEMQQSAYAQMFEDLTGMKVEGIAIMPFWIQYDESGFISNIVPEPGITLTRNANVTQVLEAGKTMKFVEPVAAKEVVDTEDWESEIRNLNLDNDHGLPLVVDGFGENYEENNPVRAEQNVRRMFGDNVEFDVNISNLLTYKGQKAFGLFKNATIQVYKRAVVGTEYHEAFHTAMHLYLTDEERNVVYKEAALVYGEMSREELEERLAESFRHYAIGRDAGVKPNSIRGKIAAFFDRLIYWAKKFVGIADINDLFRGIYSGSFNYAPTEKALAYAKRLSIPMVAEDAANVFTTQELTQYVNWATMIVAREIPAFEGVTRKQIQENRAKYSLRRRVLKRLSEHKQRLINAGETAAAAEVDRIGKMMSMHNDSLWRYVVDNVQRVLNFNIAFDETAQQDFEGNVLLAKSWDDTQAYSRSGKESFDFDLKRIIATTPRLDTIVAEEVASGVMHYENIESNNPAKLPVPLDFNTVYPLLVAHMSDANNINEMVARLKHIAVVEPGLMLLAHKLEEHTEEAQILRGKWFSNFHKPFLLSKHVEIEITVSGDIAVKADDSNKGYSYANKWIAGIKNLQAATNVENRGEKEHKLKGMTGKEIAERWRNIRSEKDVAKKAKGIAQIANLLGLPLTEEQILLVSSDPRLKFEGATIDAVFTSNMNWIVSNTVKALNEKKKLIFTETSRINTIVNYVAPFDVDFTENSFMTSKGTVMFSMTKPSFHTEFFNKIEAIKNPYTVDKEGAKRELLAFIVDKLQDPSFAFNNSIFNNGDNAGLLTISRKTFYEMPIQELMENTSFLNMTFIEKIEYARIGDVKDINAGVGQSFDRLPISDWDIHNLIHYAEAVNKNNTGFVPVFTQSDSGNIFGFTRRRFPVQFTETGVKVQGTAVGAALRNTVAAALIQAEVAGKLLFTRGSIGGKNIILKPRKLSEEQKNNLIKGVHYAEIATEDVYVDGELWFAKGDPVTIKDGRPTGRVFQFNLMNYENNSLNDIEGLTVFGVFDSSRLTPEVSQAINDYIEKFVNYLYKLEYKHYRKYKNIIFNAKARKGSKKDQFLGKWDSFENFIAEYALNNYIAYVDEAQLFMGTLAEYTHAVDMNKRAKETSSPKQTFVKTHRGHSYSAIIINDAVVASRVVDNIVEGFKEHYRRTTEMSEELIEEKVAPIRKAYSKSNSADGQGYATLDRYEKFLKDSGRWNEDYRKLFDRLRDPNKIPETDDLIALQVLKPFYFGREFNPTINMVVSRQVKLSLMPLIPSLIKGTELERIVNYLEDQGTPVEEIYFESAVKVGKQRISNIVKDGRLVDNFADNLFVHQFLNDNWGIQLDVPEHHIDADNKLGIQIIKHILTNLSDDYIYPFGELTLSGKTLKEQLHNTLLANIEEDSMNLLEDLGVKMENGKPVVDENGDYIIDNYEKIQEILRQAIRDNGLPRQLEEAIEIVTENGKPNFKMPLAFGSVRTKYEALLSSMFTSRVINQRFPGGHMVIASPALATRYLSEPDINFREEVMDRVNSGNFELQFRVIEDGKIAEAEVLMPAWSSDFFRDGERIDINEIPEELLTQIGYRIPTEGKYSTFVVKVVGFLPQAAGSTMIAPHEFVVQTGWDFDIDTAYMMTRPHHRTVNGKDAVDWIADKLGVEDKKLLSKQINIIKRKNKELYDTVPEHVWDMYIAYSEHEFKLIPVKYNEDANLSKLNRDQRNARIFDLFYSVLTHKNHFAELLTPGNYSNAKALLNKQFDLLGINANGINPFTRDGQDFFRNINIAGRALKGMAANANSSLSIMQNIGVTMRRDIGFKIAYDLNVYPRSVLTERFGSDNVTILNKDTAVVNHTSFGKTSTGVLINADGEPILNMTAEILAMVVDIVKEGFPLGVNTYTFNTFIAMLGAGIPMEYAGLFVRQAAVRAASDVALGKDGIIEGESDNAVHVARKTLSAALFHAMYRNGEITAEEVKKLRYWDKKTNDIMAPAKIAAFYSFKRLDPVISRDGFPSHWTNSQLVEMLKKEAPGAFKNLKGKERVDYLRNQLGLLNQWEVFTETGKTFADATLSLSTDKYGAGPSLSKTDIFLHRLNSIYAYKNPVFTVEKESEFPLVRLYATNQLNQRVPFIEAVYDNVETSSYKTFPAFLKFGNLNAIKTLDPLFLNRNKNVLILKERIYDSTGIIRTEENDKVIENFVMAVVNDLILAEEFLPVDQFDRILGVNVGDDLDLAFEEMSAAQKLQVVQEMALVDSSLQDIIGSPGNMLSRLTPKLEEDVIDRREIHSIEFNKPKTSDGIDDILIQDFNNLLNHPNKYVSSLARDLVYYDYVVNRQNFSSNSWNNYVPLSWYENEGILGAMRKANERLNSLDVSNSNIGDFFYRNNWNNRNIVPVVTSKFKYGEDGEILKNDQDEYILRGNSFHWNLAARVDRFIKVPNEKLKAEGYEVVKSPYILVKSGEKRILFKKFTTESDPEHTYYFPVDKLGTKFGGLEFSNKSIFPSNQVTFDQNAYEQMLSSIDPQLMEGERRALDNNDLICGI